MNSRKQPLRCEVDGDRLVISIGVNTLAWAAKLQNGGPIPRRIKIADERLWAMDVANEIVHEDEVGNTPLNELLDQTFLAAWNIGSEALVYRRPRNRRKRP